MDPEAWATLLPAALALFAVARHAVWRITRIVVTIGHEGGHALVAVLTGRRLSGIRLHSDSSGVTVSAGRPTGPGMVLTAMAGFLAPSLLGLLAAGLVTAALSRVLLWAVVGLLVVTLAYVRNLYGGMALLVTGALVGAVAWYGETEVQLAFCSATAWFLLLGGLRASWELRRGRSRQPRGRVDSDADQLARLTGVPATGWVGLFVVVGVLALALGGWWLVGDLVCRPGSTGALPGAVRVGVRA